MCCDIPLEDGRTVSSSVESDVWVSQAMTDPGLVKGFIPITDSADPERAVDAARRNETGQPLPADRFPARFFEGSQRPDEDSGPEPLPDLFNAGDFWVVSAALAQVLRGAELGRTSLYPTQLLREDRATPIDAEYFCLNFGEARDAFDAGRSPKVQPSQEKGADWLLPDALDDGDIALTPEALDGPDLWVDPGLGNAFFLSGTLVAALRDASLADGLGLRRCRVVGRQDGKDSPA